MFNLFERIKKLFKKDKTKPVECELLFDGLDPEELWPWEKQSTDHT
jgi:hypothetical protein